VPVKAVVAEREPVVAKAAAAEHMTGAKPAAMKGRTTATDAAGVNGRAMEATAAVVTAAVTTAVTSTAMTSTAMAANFGGQPVGYVFRRRRCGRIDQRQCFGALACCGRQHQDRDSRKPEAADKAAPGIWNPHHV
jgi:hypothetical protein